MLSRISDVHCGIHVILLQSELSPLDCLNMKFTPITSTGVECYFGGQYKYVLRLSALNLEYFSKFIISHCNELYNYYYFFCYINFQAFDFCITRKAIFWDIYIYIC